MIKDLLDDNETIIWEGKPDKVTYVIGSPAPYLFALIWGGFDFAFISLILSGGSGSINIIGLFLIPFFLLHLMPVWIAIGGPIYRAINWSRIHYAITQKRVYMESGIIGRDMNVIDLADINQPAVNIGVIEKLRNCGSVSLNPYISADSGGHRRAAYRASLVHIADPYDVFKLLKQISQEIKVQAQPPN